MSGNPDLHLKSSSDIQGDILAGFNKDYRMYLFYKFPDTPSGRYWLKELVPRIATTKDVAAFNDRFSAARRASGGTDPAKLKATWVNVSLTYDGVKTLCTNDPTEALKAKGFQAFVNGAASSAVHNGDAGVSDPQNWVVGGPHQNIVDAMLTVGADDPNDLTVELEKLRVLATRYGLVTIFEEHGETLPDAGRGHEHFGFKDGISQPGVVNFNTPDPNVPMVNPNDPADRFGHVLGHPGTEIIAAGEFVLGEPDESGQTFSDASLDWMKHGSFMVFRRLAQDVPSFWAQITARVHSLPPDDPLKEELLGAKLVGRWRSGTPLDLSPDTDNRAGRDPLHDNDFNFTTKDAGGNIVPDDLGVRCPRFAHIRKVYPRQNNFARNRNRRIIRRGIPFGLPFDPASGTGHGADAERGLLFISFMASIENQFEFLQHSWANNPTFPDGTAGPDPIIGDTQPRPSPVTIHRTGRPDLQLEFERFVNTMGAVYAFAPSIPALDALANGTI